jgi:predicted AAA+ superfamily ATPase
VDQREKAINSIHTAHPDTQIFLTGSNSSLLSNELSTYLRGRYLEYQVCPFSYKEYCEYHSTSLGFESFGEYLHEGGFPLLYHFTSTEREAQFQQMLDTIFMRDIIERYQIRDIPLLMELLLFIFQNSGNLTNPSKLAEHLKEKKILTNYNTMYQYLSYLKDVMLIDMVPLYDIQGKRHFERIKKYYPVDHSCINYTRSGFDL